MIYDRSRGSEFSCVQSVYDAHVSFVFEDIPRFSPEHVYLAAMVAHIEARSRAWREPFVVKFGPELTFDIQR